MVKMVAITELNEAQTKIHLKAYSFRGLANPWNQFLDTDTDIIFIYYTTMIACGHVL